MEQASGKAAVPGSSENRFLPMASATEASRRMLSLLSQSQLRQQLECQVRYFLSGRLLNCAIERESVYGYGGADQCGEDAEKSRKSLVFKATLSLVLLWLKAHGLVHTAGVLCPEADMRNSDVLSQEECQAVLQLPKDLLRRPSTPCASSALQWNLLDRLIHAASQLGAGQAASLRRSTDPVFAARYRASSAGENRCLPSDGGTSSSCRSGRTDCMQRAKRAKGISCPPRSARKQKIESVVSESVDPPSRNSGVADTKWDEWREMAQNKMLVLEAHLKGLELRESSKRLVAASEDSRHALDQRIATLESAYEKRMRQLERAVDRATGSQQAHAFESQITEHEVRSKLEARLVQQKELEARLAERETNLSKRERLLDDRERDLMRAALRIQKYDLCTEQNEANIMLTQEQPSFQSQLPQAQRQVKGLGAQLDRQATECVNFMQPTMEAKNEGDIVACTTHLPAQKPMATHSSARSEHNAAVALKQAYDGHVARLTDEIQRSNDRLRSRDAEFKLLVVELESARRKSAEAQRRLKKMQKLYEAARAACVQNRKLASSMCLSLSCIDFAVEQPAELADREVRDPVGGENVSLNACGLPHSASNVPDLFKSDQSPIQGYGISLNDHRWICLNDVNNGPPEVEIHEQNCWNAACNMQGQHPKSRSYQTTANFGDTACPGFQQSNLAGSEGQALSSRLHCLNTDLERQSQQFIHTPNPVNRMQTVSTTPEDPGHTCFNRSEPMMPLRVGQERHLRTGTPTPTGEAGDSNSSAVREEVFKETIRTSCSSASIIFSNSASHLPLPREAPSARLDLHCASLKEEASATLRTNEHTRTPAVGAAVDHPPEQQQEPQLDPSSDSSSGSLLKAEQGSAYQAGMESEANINIGLSGDMQLLASPEGSAGPVTPNAPLSGQDVPLPRSSPREISNVVPCSEPETITIMRRQSVERILRPPVKADNSAYGEGPSTTIEYHNTLNATQATPARQEQEVAGTNPPFPPQVYTSGGGEPTGATPRGSSECEIPRISVAPASTPMERSQVVEHKENEGAKGSRLQSPWAEASIASSLPESPQGLSNFPSLSCPVAATIEGIPSPTLRKLDYRGRWAVAQKKSDNARGAPASSSPSEHEWLACVSPTDPIIHTDEAECHGGA
ncbi:hypothetical protein, conserved [Eimeria maxima]|uniref:LisH domain-containing protein n=1 Tax=Eimeria maxima TaxID=5804 RepID=U6LWX5_EIMMA|nr:hypothetical protein, conserved [Eimeria maxima]CDJ56457.1 hypothetical protein, conserved [Eimeria maxima]